MPACKVLPIGSPVWSRRLVRIAGFLSLVLLCACYRVRAPDTAPLQIPPPPISELRLANGLRVFVVERHSAPTFAAVYSFDVGAADDPRGRSGIAHLLE